MAELDMLKMAHKHSIFHREEVLTSKICSCFYCREIFTSDAISEWTDEDDATALCPKCGIDAVIGDKSGYPIETLEFLDAMYAYWFERTVYVEN